MSEEKKAPDLSKWLDPKWIEKTISENPIFFVLIGALIVLTVPPKTPAWLKDLPPIGGRRAGPWRGKGSFGKGFGPQARHK